MASSQASDGKPSRGGRFRSLIPKFLRRTAPPPVATSSLAVRPPWWRMVATRMVGGLWPGFRSGQGSSTDSKRGGSRAATPRTGPPARPLVAQRLSLAAKPSILPTRRQSQRSPLATSPSFGVAGGMAPELTMAPPPGLPSVGTGQESTTATPVVQEPHHVTVRRESAKLSVAGTPVQSAGGPAALKRSILVRQSLVVQRQTPKGTAAPGSAPGSAAPRGFSLAMQAPPIPVTVQRAEDEQSTQDVTPEQRWRAAVASVPLEAPRAFPTHMRPLVAQLTGRSGGATYTTGTATRRALSEVGALGATTGSTVHLAQEPSMDSASLGVLAHELTHAASPVSRPRFMLHHHVGAMDSDERHARSVGSAFDAAASTIAPMGVQRLALPGASSGLTGAAGSTEVAPVRVQRFSLPGGSSNLISGLTNQVTGAMGSLGHQATDAVGGLADRGRSAINDGASSVRSYVGDAASSASSAVGGLNDRFASAATGLGDQAANEIQSVSAGLVNQLPVGGAGLEGITGAVAELARNAAHSAVQEAGQLTQGAQGAIGGLQGMANQGVSGLAGQADQLVSGVQGHADQWVNGAMSQAQGAVQGVGNDVSQAVGGAENAAASGINSVLNTVGNALGPGATPQISGQDLDRIAEALEERLLRQLERRGGRYAGVF